MTRFAIYETVRDKLSSRNQGPMPFYQKILLAAFGGKNVPLSQIHFEKKSVKSHGGKEMMTTVSFLGQLPSKITSSIGLTGGFVGTPADMVNVR